MNGHSAAQNLLFPGLFVRSLLARFDLQHGSSDGGAVLLKAVDRRLQLIEALAACVRDSRPPGKVEHELVELLSQRVLGIACGYPDANDAARLANDPIHKLLVDRHPIDGTALALQPTLSRFENAAGPRQVFGLGESLEDVVFTHHARRRRQARRVTIDLDATEDPTHGARQLTFFNGHYDASCYLPLLGFASFDAEAEQRLFTAVLRPGSAPAKRGAMGVLRRAILRLAEEVPRSRILVRLDGGFASPELFDAFEELPGVDYVVGLGANSVLRREAKRLMRRARKLSRRTGRTAHVYGECLYQARSWPHPRRVIINAEVVTLEGRQPKDNPRFVVTTLRDSPRTVYERVCCRRGEIENRIKELQVGLDIDRTSCTWFWANQLRVLMTAAACVLMQELRRHLARTTSVRAQVWTLCERFVKLGAHAAGSVRRIVVHLPASFPFLQAWSRAGLALGARAG